MVRYLLSLRGLIGTLTSRELKARYRGSLLGFVWSLANPLLLLAVYTLVFDVIFKPRMAGASPYSVFLLTGLFPWIWLSTSLIEATSSLLTNAGVIRKAVFPAEVLPVVAVLANLVHFLFALPIILGALAAARFLGYSVGGWSILLLPACIVVLLPFAAGLGLALSALNVHFKDTRDLLQNLLTLLFFLTPILYPVAGLSHLPWLRWVMSLNPGTPFVRLFQEALFYGRVPEIGLWLQAMGLALLAWTVGGWIFRRLSPTLVEAV
jgi:ABC-type polysaccharide/polyol phosphate export permease